jgi:hypothetical protein
VSGDPSTGPTSDQFTLIAADDAGKLPGQISDSNPAASVASAHKAATSNLPITAFPPLAEAVILMTDLIRK